VAPTWTQQLYSAGGPFRLASTRQSAVAGQSIVCGIAADSSVWCFPASGTLTDSTLLGAGLGSTESTSGPVPVVTSLTGGALTNVKQLSASREPNANAFCALVGDGSIWCWGRGNWGQLGHGDTANSNYARQVLASAGTPFTGAAQVTMGTETTCARKTDGTVWCWGTNGQGELGVPKATLAASYYPVQVPLVGTTAQRTAKQLATGSYQTHCAITQDTTVQCWGNNTNGAAGNASGATATPTQILMAANGAALSAVSDLTSVGSVTMLANTSNGLTAWGNVNGQTTVYPATVLDGSNLPITQVNLPLASGNNIVPYWEYIDSAGRVFSNNGTTYSLWSPQPPCTNLLSP